MKQILVIIVVLSILLFGFRTYKQKNISEVDKMKINKISPTIITIYDNYQHNTELDTGWGFSCLIKTDNKNILFDTGADSPTLLSNIKKLEIEPKDIDIIVLSHIHGDHTGGLFGLLQKNPNVTVYLPKSFPNDLKTKITSYGANIIEVKDSIKISDGICSTGELGIWIKEQSLMINTKNGLIVITGCAHPGIVNIIKKSKEITNENIYLVLGGFHLGGTSDSEINSIIKNFRKLGVKKVAPCHCTGDIAIQLFEQEYKDDFIENGVGKIIKI